MNPSMRLNQYGIGAGWYMFELADKAGQKYLHAKYPQVKYWLTSKICYGLFAKQVAPDDDLRASVITSIDNGKAAHAIISVFNKDAEIVAQFSLDYIARDHLSVQPKEN